MRDDEASTKRTAKPAGSRERDSGFRALVEALRSLPERFKRPESLIMIMALLASFGAHMPPYVGLGVLAEFFERQERDKPVKAPPIEVSFEVAEPETPEQPEPEEPELEPEKLAKKPEPPEKKEPEEPKPAPEEKPKVPVSKLELADKPEPPPPPPSQTRKQSVTQKSEDPNVEPPPDAKYLAEESRRVEEETVASVTSETRDDAELQEAAPQADGPEKFGEDAHEDERGAEEGAEEEEPAKVASLSPREEPAPRPPEPAQSEPPEPVRPSVAPQKPAPAPAPAPAEQPTIIHDPLGSFVLAPQRPRSSRSAEQAGSAGQKAPPSLRVSWRAFEDTFGADQLAMDRMPREAKRRGAGREKRWGEFRAAIENYIVGVKPGNTTALNAAADPFAAYLAAFHRNLHMEFAHEFLGALPAMGELGDPELVTKVEIVVNPDGSLDRVGVVKSSGNLMYDFGAFNAVQRGAPYPSTPEKIRSPDGRVYMRWALHRNESQCGTWNAEPYILKTPPRSPNDPKQDNVSPFRPSDEQGEHGHAPRDVPAAPGAATRVGETLGLLPARRTPRGA